MIVPDVNLLVYAHNSEVPFHDRARRWWEDRLNQPAPVGLSWVTISGFIRLMTHPRVLVSPMTVDAAVDQVDSWLAQPCVVLLEPGRRFPQVFLDGLRKLGTAGNLTTDAYLAALAIEHQADLCSCDGDFARFAGLRWSNPIEKPLPKASKPRAHRRGPRR
ncbi:MAG: type II toxin-antitoxin system VapC family toxin [Opitutaceae bacterium]